MHGQMKTMMIKRALLNELKMKLIPESLKIENFVNSELRLYNCILLTYPEPEIISLIFSTNFRLIYLTLQLHQQKQSLLYYLKMKAPKFIPQIFL